MSKKNRTPALAYLRTSSSTNVGADKDSDKRQRAAIEAFAKRAGYELVGEYYDQAVRGADLRRPTWHPPVMDVLLRLW
jgi:DNA invertase Pin-like site-specific DNA recombinase